MSDIQISRRGRVFPVIVATTVDHATTVDVSEFSGASILLDNNPSSNATRIDVFGSDRPTGTFARLENSVMLFRPSGQLSEVVSDGTTTTTVFTATFTTQSGVYKLPDSVFPIGAVRLVSDAELGSSVTTVLILKT